MKERATVAAIATSIAIVNEAVKKGEKVFNAYICVSIRFNCCLWCDRLGCSLSALLLSIVTNGVSPHRVMRALYAHKTKVSSFFLSFFFVGCGRVGVGAWVWAPGCGRVGVGAWVGRWGRRDEDGRARDMAGWIGIVAVGCARLASQGFPIPKSDCRLGCDR